MSLKTAISTVAKPKYMKKKYIDMDLAGKCDERFQQPSHKIAINLYPLCILMKNVRQFTKTPGNCFKMCVCVGVGGFLKC